MKKLVFIHGRSQQFKDADELKKQWIDSFRQGLEKSNLDLPISEDDIRFPYYGQALHDLVKGATPEEAAKVIVRGEAGDQAEEQFAAALFKELRSRFGITNDQLREAGDPEVIERGILNWEWVQTILKGVEKFVPGASAASVALATSDVYQYLTNLGLQDIIDSGVKNAINSDEETVVVSHSLGTVVAYRLLSREGQNLGWKIPTHVTLGSPLAVKVIQERLAPIRFPSCVGEWFNAMDERDVVALYPLNESHFPIGHRIENKTDVDNWTTNRHGIIGYLSDAEVAKRIFDALQ